MKGRRLSLTQDEEDEAAEWKQRLIVFGLDEGDLALVHELSHRLTRIDGCLWLDWYRRLAMNIIGDV
jgi:hypothetical protein